MMTARDAPTRPPTYLGIFLVALATLMYEILLTRIFSVTMLYHFAFVALSVAMFGLTAGALIVYLAPHWFPPDRLSQRLALAATVFPIALVLSFLIELRIPFRVSWSWLGLGDCADLCRHLGAICCQRDSDLPHPHSLPQPGEPAFAADLAGAALGCVLLIGVLNWSAGRRQCSGWRGWQALAEWPSRLMLSQ